VNPAVRGGIFPITVFLYAPSDCEVRSGSVGSEACVCLTDDDAKALIDWAMLAIPIVVLAEKSEFQKNSD